MFNECLEIRWKTAQKKKRKKKTKLYLVSCQFICRVFKLIFVKLLIVCVFTMISQGAPLGLAVEMN